jgi:hypothetical protein
MLQDLDRSETFNLSFRGWLSLVCGKGREGQGYVEELAIRA